MCVGASREALWLALADGALALLWPGCAVGLEEGRERDLYILSCVNLREKLDSLLVCQKG